jgi:hypothetical protein
MMTGRVLRRLTHRLEAAASQALGKPARVVLLQAGELVEEVRAQYFQGNSAAIGRHCPLAAQRRSAD